MSVAFLMTLPAFAEEAYWQPTAAGTYEWSEVANWQDGSGATLSLPPTNATDNIHFDLEAAGAQTIKFFPLVNSDIPASSRVLALGAVSGAASTNRTIATRGRDWWGTYRELFLTITNPNGFLGRWETLDVMTTLRLSGGTDSFTPCLNELSAKHRPLVDVPADKKGTIAHLVGGDTYAHSTGRHTGDYGAGELVKTGAGELEIATIGEPDTLDRLDLRLRVKAGTLTVDGQADAAVATPVPGAYFRVDATRTDTMTLETRSDGRRYVTEWRDADGGDVKAVERVAGSYYTGGTPFLSASADVSGRPMVDFGAFFYDNKGTPPDAALVAELGMPACLDFAQTEDVKAVFYVFEYTMATNNQPAILGASDAYDYVHGYTKDEAHPSDGNLYIDYLQKKASQGVIDIDGMLECYSTKKDWTKLTLVNSRPSGACALSNFGRDRYWGTGGFRLAEAIIYTNELTAAECARNNRYLLAKWKTSGEYPDHDCAVIASDSATAAVCVPAGRTVKVRTLVANGGTFVKTGEGTLLCERLEPASAVLDVRAGRVDFLPQVAADDSAPAADPYLWLDAESEASVVEGTDGVTRWNDRRDGAEGTDYCYASALQISDEMKLPTRRTRADGKHYIDFGCGWYSNGGARDNAVGGTYGDSAIMEIWQQGGSDMINGREGFVVLRPKWPSGNPDNSTTVLNQNFFGVNHLQWCRIGGTKGAWLTDYTSPSGLSTEWACDGVPVDPFAFCDIGTNAFRVVRVSGGENLRFDMIARDGGWTYGGIEVAEEIIYNRRLTAKERVDTEAYLMKKWLGASHPSQTRRQVGTVVVQDDLPAVVASDEDMAIAAIQGGNGMYVKSGAGTATVAETLNGDVIAGISVTGGALEASVGLLDESIYHFDASDVSTLTTSVEGTTTNVLCWASANGNGARADGKIQYTSKTYPTLTNVETRAGVSRTVLDFGGLSVLNTSIQTNNSAGLVVTCTDGDQVREYYAVRTDANFEPGDHSTTGYQYRWILTDTESIFSRHDYGYMFVSWLQTHWDALNNGVLMLDETVLDSPMYQWNDDRFHVFSCRPDGPIKVRTIAYDRCAFSAGGCQYGEIIAFSKTNSTAAATYLRKKLIYKWLGEGEEPVFTNATMTALTVANGATLTLKNAPNLAAKRFGGAGAMTFGAVTVLEALVLDGPLAITGDVALAEGASVSVAFPNATDYGRLAVTGTLSLPQTIADGSISVTLGADARRYVGRYPLFTLASSAEASRVAKWRVQVIGAVPSSRMRLVADGPTVCLAFVPLGTMINIR